MLYKITHKDSNSEARTGVLSLTHGSQRTPLFMPVGTGGTVRAVRPETLQSLGFSLILGNTYHLYLRPGIDVIKRFAGLHQFSNWQGNILTDSGGYQIFSLSSLRKIYQDGVEFRSHIDGSIHRLSPENIVDIQYALNSDIQMPLDLCTPDGVSYNEAKRAVELTTQWAKRAKKHWLQLGAHNKNELWGIIQGNFYEDLRIMSVEEITALDFSAYAIGGLSVGEDKSKFLYFLAHSAALLPVDKPRYLMGIGSPVYILEAIEHGIDMFDCVLPTRIARNGTLLTSHGRLVLKNKRYKFDMRPIMEKGPIVNYSRSYLRHLFKSGEILGPMLASIHNLWFLKDLVQTAAAAIERNDFLTFKKNFLYTYQSGIDE